MTAFLRRRSPLVLQTCGATLAPLLRKLPLCLHQKLPRPSQLSPRPLQALQSMR